MGKQLSPETETALRKLAREIGQARGLGEDAQEELYGHLEDKTLGYLSGEDGITEADAVLLTREHFRESTTSLDINAPATVPLRSAAFARRIAAIAVADLLMGVGVGALLSIIGVVLLVFNQMRLRSDTTLMMCIAAPCILGLIAVRWSFRKSDTGEGQESWYLRWKPRSIVALVCALLVVRGLIPFGFDLFNVVHLPSDRLPQRVIEWFLVALPVLWVSIWFKWIGDGNRSFAALLAGGAVWFALRLSYDVPESLLGHVSLYHNAGGEVAWAFIPGRLFIAPNNFLSLARSTLGILWRSGWPPLAFIVLMTVLYVLQHHMTRAVQLYMRSCRNNQGGISWLID